MDTWKISGGESLFGSVRIPGAKNSVLPLMAASAPVQWYSDFVGRSQSL